MKNLPSVNEVADSEAEAKIVSVGNLSLDSANEENHASNSALKNAKSLKMPAYRKAWHSSKGLTSSDKSDNHRRSGDEGDFPDVLPASDTSSIVHRGPYSKVEACLLSEDLQARLMEAHMYFK